MQATIGNSGFTVERLSESKFWTHTVRVRFLVSNKRMLFRLWFLNASIEGNLVTIKLDLNPSDNLNELDVKLPDWDNIEKLAIIRTFQEWYLVTNPNALFEIE